jgi:phage terminase Nu1 subunit (DNA packaging protein)
MEGLFGDEFPEAFGGGAQNKKTITDLPAELLEIVCEHISKLDIKRLRLASKHLASSVYLRIDRIYVSPNRANLDYLHQILAHPTYSSRVHEIVWDDALLNEYETLQEFRDAIATDERETTRAIESRLEEALDIYGDENPEYRSLEMEDLLRDGRLTEVAKGILLRYDDQFSSDVLARNAAMMSIEDSYSLYQELFRQERELVKQQIDAAALQQALRGFPNARRITITTDVWPSWNVLPRYNTPYHRSLPFGFRKPAVWPWLRPRHQSEAIFDQWSCHDGKDRDLLPGERRSYGVVVSAILAMPNPQIEEFIMESEHKAKGYHHCFLIETSRNYQITKQLFQRTPLKHVKLIITPPNDYIRNEEALTNVQSLLSELQCLEHLDLSFNDSRSARTARFFLQLNPIPATMRSRLRSLTLRNVKLSEEHLRDIFTTSPNLQQVTIYDCFQRIRPACEWPWLFRQLRKYYNREEDVSKPSFTVVAPLSCQYLQLVDEEVDAFLYGDDEAECPFVNQPPTPGGNAIKPHMGWKIWNRDESVRERMTEVAEREEMQERDDM